MVALRKHLSKFVGYEYIMIVILFIDQLVKPFILL